ncbi:oxygenase MpaB family protein [Marinobacter sediminicola]|uniref:oxygenase MpaB family protein n=1 Tax=Marinobacter sediminicola TaxID=3072994 RepID=UPI00281113D9|nr:oxygenase MpaB family protein [Marinobacter sp. F26243]
MDRQKVPSRHGTDRAEAERIAKPLLWLIRDRKAAVPDEQQWQRMGEALMVGDPVADDLAKWVRGEGGGKAFSQFKKILDSGNFDQKDMAPPLRAFFDAIKQPPAWVDWERLERGARASAISGQTGMRVLRDLGLMAGYQARGINQTLIMTGALERGATRRVAETTKWWLDCITPGGLNRDAEGFKTTLRVRLIHAMVRQQLLDSPDWDTSEWGLPVNQLDMQATYLAFSVSFLFGQKLMGTLISRQDSEDIMHLWRYIGWLMGVDESLLCESEQEGRIALYQNVISQATADENSRKLGRALMDEPLGRRYPNFGKIRGRWERQVHLSMTRLFVGGKGMEALGLPKLTLPWYPAVFAPLNAAWTTGHRILPGGRNRLMRRGRKAQRNQLQTLFGEDHPEITSGVQFG